MSSTLLNEREKPVIDYELTEAERRIVAWLRLNGNGRSDWMGTVRYVAGAEVWQMTDHTKAGQVHK